PAAPAFRNALRTPVHRAARLSVEPHPHAGAHRPRVGFLRPRSGARVNGGHSPSHSHARAAAGNPARHPQHSETALKLLGGIYAIWLREVKRALRDRGQLIGGISRPILWLLIMGIGLNPYFRGEVYGEVRFVIPYTYVQFIFPAIIMLNIMYTSVQSAVSVIWDREFGFLREVLVSPMPRWAVLLGKILGGTTIAVLHGSLVLVLARFANIP